jgi:hypothetical protein
VGRTSPRARICSVPGQRARCTAGCPTNSMTSRPVSSRSSSIAPRGRSSTRAIRRSSPISARCSPG